VAAAANAIMGLADDWEEVMHCSAGCGDGVHAQASDEPFEFRLFRRRLN
jgi:hypothetical protein